MRNRSLAQLLEASRAGRTDDECWPWAGRIEKDGYGRIKTKTRKETLAHRVVWTEKVGPIPEGMELDHLCHTNDPTCFAGPLCPHRACVNYLRHLEVVEPVVNLVRRHLADGRTSDRYGGSDATSYSTRASGRNGL